MSGGLRRRRPAKALRLELTAIYVEKEFSPECAAGDAPAPTNPAGPCTVRAEHVDAAAQLQEQRQADSRTAMRPPVMEPAPSHTTTASRKVEVRLDDCVEEIGAQEGPSNGGERDRARDNVALEDITLHSRALEHAVHILPSQRPPLNETPAEEAARKFGCRFLLHVVCLRAFNVNINLRFLLSFPHVSIHECPQPFRVTGRKSWRPSTSVGCSVDLCGSKLGSRDREVFSVYNGAAACSSSMALGAFITSANIERVPWCLFATRGLSEPFLNTLQGASLCNQHCPFA